MSDSVTFTYVPDCILLQIFRSPQRTFFLSAPSEGGGSTDVRMYGRTVSMLTATNFSVRVYTRHR